MEASEDTIYSALEGFKLRMTQLGSEAEDISAELARKDLLLLAGRARELVRQTRRLLEKNIAVLFIEEPPEVQQDLFAHLEYAEDHLQKALSVEFEFESIDRRIYMATRLINYVINGVGISVKHLEERL